MTDIISVAGTVLFPAGVIWLIIRPTYGAAALTSLGIGIAGMSIPVGLATFGILGGLTLLFGNPFAQRRRTSISTGRPDGSRTGSSPSNTP